MGIKQMQTVTEQNSRFAQGFSPGFEDGFDGAGFDGGYYGDSSNFSRFGGADMLETSAPRF